MATPEESDFPKGHPGRADYDPNTPEAREWMRRHSSPLGERDFPVDHPGALDTPGNLNSRVIVAGVDPDHPEREAFTGRTPEIAARVREQTARLTREAKETPAREPVEAPPPPANPGDTRAPSGQPDTQLGVIGRMIRGGRQ